MGVSVAYAGQHLDHLGTIAEGVRMGYVIPGMLSVIAFYAAKSAFSEIEQTNARVIAGITALVVAVVSVNISGRAMEANDLKAVTTANNAALEKARTEYVTQEAIRKAQFDAALENGKASKFAEKSSFLEVKINTQQKTVDKARSVYSRWDYKLSKGNKQSADTKASWKSAKADLDKERDILNRLIEQKTAAMSGAITTAESYQPAVFVEPVKIKTDPFIWTYAGTIEAYLFFIAFMFRERKVKKAKQQKVKPTFNVPCFSDPQFNVPSFNIPVSFNVPTDNKRDVKEGRNTATVKKSSTTDIAFSKATKEAEVALQAINEAQEVEDAATKKEQCLNAIVMQTISMKDDAADLVDKTAAENKYGRKAADYAFKKSVSSGYLIATGRGRGRKYLFPSNVTPLVARQG